MIAKKNKVVILIKNASILFALIIIFAFIILNVGLITIKKSPKLTSAIVSYYMGKEVLVSNSDIIFYKDFPKVSLILEDVTIKDKCAVSNHKEIFTANKLNATFNIKKMFVDKFFYINELILENSNIYVEVFKDGTNFDNCRKRGKDYSPSSFLIFNKNTKLINSEIKYLQYDIYKQDYNHNIDPEIKVSMAIDSAYLAWSIKNYYKSENTENDTLNLFDIALDSIKGTVNYIYADNRFYDFNDQFFFKNYAILYNYSYSNSLHSLYVNRILPDEKELTSEEILHLEKSNFGDVFFTDLIFELSFDKHNFDFEIMSNLDFFANKDFIKKNTEYFIPNIKSDSIDFLGFKSSYVNLDNFKFTYSQTNYENESENIFIISSGYKLSNVKISDNQARINSNGEFNYFYNDYNGQILDSIIIKRLNASYDNSKIISNEDITIHNLDNINDLTLNLNLDLDLRILKELNNTNIENISGRVLVDSLFLKLDPSYIESDNFNQMIGDISIGKTRIQDANLKLKNNNFEFADINSLLYYNSDVADIVHLDFSLNGNNISLIGNIGNILPAIDDKSEKFLVDAVLKSDKFVFDKPVYITDYNLGDSAKINADNSLSLLTDRLNANLSIEIDSLIYVDSHIDSALNIVIIKEKPFLNNSEYANKIFKNNLTALRIDSIKSGLKQEIDFCLTNISSSIKIDENVFIDSLIFNVYDAAVTMSSVLKSNPNEPCSVNIKLKSLDVDNLFEQTYNLYGQIEPSKYNNVFIDNLYADMNIYNLFNPEDIKLGVEYLQIYVNNIDLDNDIFNNTRDTIVIKDSVLTVKYKTIKSKSNRRINFDNEYALINSYHFAGNIFDYKSKIEELYGDDNKQRIVFNSKRNTNLFMPYNYYLRFLAPDSKDTVYLKPVSYIDNADNTEHNVEKQINPFANNFINYLTSQIYIDRINITDTKYELDSISKDNILTSVTNFNSVLNYTNNRINIDTIGFNALGGIFSSKNAGIKINEKNDVEIIIEDIKLDSVNLKKTYDLFPNYRDIVPLQIANNIDKNDSTLINLTGSYELNYNITEGIFIDSIIERSICNVDIGLKNFKYNDTLVFQDTREVQLSRNRRVNLCFLSDSISEEPLQKHTDIKAIITLNTDKISGGLKLDSIIDLYTSTNVNNAAIFSRFIKDDSLYFEINELKLRDFINIISDTDQELIQIIDRINLTSFKLEFDSLNDILVSFDFQRIIIRPTPKIRYAISVLDIRQLFDKNLSVGNSSMTLRISPIDIFEGDSIRETFLIKFEEPLSFKLNRDFDVLIYGKYYDKVIDIAIYMQSNRRFKRDYEVFINATEDMVNIRSNGVRVINRAIQKMGNNYDRQISETLNVAESKVREIRKHERRIKQSRFFGWIHGRRGR